MRVASAKRGEAILPARYFEVDPSGVAQLDLEEAIEPGDVTLRFDLTRR